MPSVQIKRGTAAALSALAAGAGLLPGEQYLITDQQRVAVALTTSTFQGLAKLSEVGGFALNATIEVNSATPYTSKFFTASVPGATPGQKVIASVSLDMPAGVAMDEIEADPIAVGGRVSAADTVQLLVASVNGSPIGGKRNINVVVL
jgi:hypothetical protein